MTDQVVSLSPTGIKGKELIFRINENGPDALREVLLERGWKEFIEGEHAEHEWNLWWRSNRFRTGDYEDVMPWQRINHFPKTVAITRKDMLARNMRRMCGVYGASVYNFTPLAFNLPNDYTKFVAEYTRSVNQQQQEQQEANAAGECKVPTKNLWICKPADLSRGRGIFIFKELSELTYDCAAVAQKYITNPLLIGGYKFDLRIYVLVTSFHPLNIYVYQEGIARFSTEKFDLTSFDNLYAHLTNTSINKLGPSYSIDKERVGPGCKWSLTMLRNYFRQQNIDDVVLWQKINNIITWTLLAQATTVPKVSSCFELFGFDILIDDNLKPWLLEVNFSPALGLDCQTDYAVKKPLLNDMMTLLGYKEGDADRGGETYNRLTKLKHLHQFGKMSIGYSKPSTAKTAVKKSWVGPSKTTLGKHTSRSSLPIKTTIQNTLNKNETNLRTALQSSSQSSIQSSSRSPCIDSIRTYKRMSSKSSSNADICNNEYSSELAAVCSKSSLESKLNEATNSKSPERRSRLSLPPRRVYSQVGLPNVRTGSLDSFANPSVEESKRKLQMRREAMYQRQKKTASLSPVRVKTGRRSNINLNDDPVCSLSGTHKNPDPTRSRLPQNTIGRSTSQPYLGRFATDILTRSTTGATGHEATQTRSRNEAKTYPSSSALQRTPQVQQPKPPVVAESKPTTPRTNNMKSGPGSTFNARKQLPSYQGGKKAEVASTETNSCPAQVGEFVLTFPFNDATQRASFSSLDIRTIIKETQKQVRRTICKASSTRKRVATTVAYKVPINKGVLRGTISFMTEQTAASTGINQGDAGQWAPTKPQMETVKF